MSRFCAGTYSWSRSCWLSPCGGLTGDEERRLVRAETVVLKAMWLRSVMRNAKRPRQGSRRRWVAYIMQRHRYENCVRGSIYIRRRNEQ